MCDGYKLSLFIKNGNLFRACLVQLYHQVLADHALAFAEPVNHFGRYLNVSETVDRLGDWQYPRTGDRAVDLQRDGLLHNKGANSCTPQAFYQRPAPKGLAQVASQRTNVGPLAAAHFYSQAGIII